MNSLRTHKHRKDLTGEYAFGDFFQVVFFILFLAIWITDSFFFNYSTILNNYIPLTIRLTLGIIILLLAAYLAWKGHVIIFHEVREKPHVIRKSVLGVIRHPMYTGEMLLYIGLSLASISLAGIGLCFIIFAYLHYLCRYEEKLLLGRFGKDYRKYMNEVGMFFPKLKK